MDAHVVEPGPHADGLPRRVDVGHVRARLGSRNDPETAGLGRQGLQDADGLPRPVDVGHVRARLGSRNDPETAGLGRQGLQDADGRRRQVDRAGARLSVDDAHLGLVEIDVLPAQSQDFVSAAFLHPAGYSPGKCSSCPLRIGGSAADRGQAHAG